MMRWIVGAAALAFPVVAQERPMDLRLDETTADWRADLDGGEVGHYAIIGDSISYRPDSYIWFLRPMLEEVYGNAGDGYLAFGFGFRHAEGSQNRRPGLGFRRSNPTWTQLSDIDGFRDSFGERSIDGIYARIGAIGWIEVDFYGPEATLHYIREPGAGIIRIAVSGVEVAQVDASMATGPAQLGTFTFQTGQSDPTTLTTVRFSLVGANTQNPQWTQLNGLQMTTGLPGIMYSRLARGGAGPDEFLRADPEVFAASLQALGPDLLVLMTDHSTQSPYQEDLNALLDRIEAALPNVEILLATHHNFRQSAGDDADAMLSSAQQRGHGYLNLFDLHEGFEHLDDLGFLVDSVHFTALGGQWFGRFFLHALHGWTVATETSPALGTIESGGLYESRGSDDQRLLVRSIFGFNAMEPHVSEQLFRFVTDLTDPEFIDLRIEARSDHPDTEVRLRLRNAATGAFDLVDSFSLGIADSVHEVHDVPGDLYQEDGVVELRVRCSVLFAFSVSGFRVGFDHIQGRMRP